MDRLLNPGPVRCSPTALVARGGPARSRPCEVQPSFCEPVTSPVRCSARRNNGCKKLGQFCSGWKAESRETGFRRTEFLVKSTQGEHYGMEKICFNPSSVSELIEGMRLRSLIISAMATLLCTTSALAAAPGGAATGATLSSSDSVSLMEFVQSGIDGAVTAAESAGEWGWLYFSAAYVVATVLLVPGSVLTIAAGYIFGPLKGTAVVSLASTLGASAAFLISRYIARPFVAQQLAKFDEMDLVDRAIAQDGWKIVALWRLSPLFPFTLSNYMFGLTGISFVEYVLASWLAMLPGTFTYVYLGGAGRATVDAVADAGSGVEPLKLVLYGVGAMATLLVTREVSLRATKALEEAAAKKKQSDDAAASTAVAAAASVNAPPQTTDDRSK